MNEIVVKLYHRTIFNRDCSLAHVTQFSFFRAVFKFEGNNLNVTATGKDFKDFKSAFTNDDRGFGYIRISVSIYKKFSQLPNN